MPLHHAAGSGQLEATRVLLEHTADASATRCKKMGYTDSLKDQTDF